MNIEKIREKFIKARTTVRMRFVDWRDTFEKEFEEALAELSKPKCLTCNDTGVVCDDEDLGGHAVTNSPCPDCKPTVEKILWAAVRLDNGLIFTGKNHSDVILTSIKVNHIEEHFSQDKQGFVTSEFRYVNRKEAAQIAYNSGQIKEKAEVLISEDLTLSRDIPCSDCKPEKTELTEHIREVVSVYNQIAGNLALKACCEIDRLNTENRTLFETNERLEYNTQIYIQDIKKQSERIKELEQAQNNM